MNTVTFNNIQAGAVIVTKKENHKWHYNGFLISTMRGLLLRDKYSIVKSTNSLEYCFRNKYGVTFKLEIIAIVRIRCSVIN